MIFGRGVRFITVNTIEKRIAELKEEMDKNADDEKEWKLLEARRDELKDLLFNHYAK